MIDFLSQYINLTWIYWFLTVAYAITIISIAAVIVSENRNPVKTLAWVTVLLALPAVGLILYLIVGRNIKNKHKISRRNRRKLRRLEGDSQSSNVHKHLSATSRQMSHLASSLVNARMHHGNDADIFTDGKSKFDALLADLKDARHSINMQYYIIADDNIGNKVKEVLMDRARNGVKVRIIYDHVGSFRVKKRFFNELRAAGIEVYPFFKVKFPVLGSRINWRNHRKIVIIDGMIGYIGGMNIADRYIDGGNFDLWRDLHLRVKGPAVRSLLHSFAVDWNFMGHDLIEEDFRAENPETGDISMQLITGGPTSQWDNLSMMFIKAINQAQRSIFIMTPYFIPTEPLLKALQTAALSGVDVRILMPERSDSDLLRLASFSFISQCLQSGIKIYLFQPGMLHSKAILVDNDFVSLGSTNFDFRSVEHNFEGNLMIYSTEFNSRLRKLFIADAAQSRRIYPAPWRKRSKVQKALESFMRLFAPIL